MTMEITFILAIIIGLVLGAIITWLYCKSAFGKNTISTEKYEALRTEQQALQTQLAVAAGKITATERDLEQAKGTTMQLRADGQKTLLELEATKTVKDNALLRLKEITEDSKAQQEELKQKTELLIIANNSINRMEEELKNKNERLVTQKQDLEEVKTKLESEFRIIAGAVLDNSSQKMTQQQTEKLNDLLKPFREQIDGFKKDIDSKFTNEAAEKGSLKQQIESLVNLNQSIAKEALALTEALRGSTKKQGDWGEDILERILEYSGLQKDVHYFVQQQSQNDEGKIIRPDIIVRYPDTRYLVIDAKVSLTHYWDYCNAAAADDQKMLLPKIVGSLKAHIDGLAAKKYTDIAGTPDFIIMFMPVEAAYITAMQSDHTLWQYAYDRKILLISPTNLLPAMKMVSIMWDKDAVNRDGEQIVKKAVGLYEKFHGFITTFESVGADIDRAQKRWAEAKGQLHTGRDNFISQGGKLKQLLGNRTKKELPPELLDAAELEEDTRTE